MFIETRPCMICGEKSVLDLPEEQVALWRGGMLVQRAFPDLAPAQREMLISGTHPACWDAEFNAQGED